MSPSSNLTQVTIVTDGACKGNPGPGGYAAILQSHKGQHEKVIVGGAIDTTNNRMELMAVIAGLEALNRPCQVQLIVDSQYVATMLNGGKAKANHDLVGRLCQLAAPHQIVIDKVNGHSGHPLNERADQLAAAEALRQKGIREEIVAITANAIRGVS